MRERPGPDFIRATLERASVRPPLGPPAARIAGVLDHTLLRADATPREIDRLCEESIRFGFAAVCVNPVYVRRAVARLGDTRVRVASVAGFPLGASNPSIKIAEVQRAVEEGAREVDMVIAQGAFKAGDLDAVAGEIREAAGKCHEEGAILKAILETALLTDEEKVLAAWISRESGADFVKTSTGFGSGGATAGDVAILRETVGDEFGVKASGGIRTLAQARSLLAAGADRLGTSHGVRLVEEEADETRRAAHPGDLGARPASGGPGGKGDAPS